jgi:hypothetical protein
LPIRTRSPVFSIDGGRAAKVVELRFFGGLSETEAAEALQISLATLKRNWDFARGLAFGSTRLKSFCCNDADLLQQAMIALKSQRG